MRINRAIGLAVAAAMVAGLFLPFFAWQGQSLSLAALTGGDDGVNYLLGLLVLLGAGAVACALTDDLPGLFPIGALYLVFPAYVLHEAGRFLGEAAPAAGGLPPFAGEPAALGATIVFLAAYGAMLLAVVDWWTGRRRRRRQP